jgi:NADH:ubiquinone oxidoreductase subunit 6 (subunit J)
MELTLFIIVGAVAVAAAAMMLISENAVHSALFLILNFACIAFFFLMLNAPFLAMVQITVYAGAIMVLFLFVIMLLGAERLLPEQKPRFPWLTPVAIILALVFLVTASLAIIRGEIDVTDPARDAPRVRVVHAVGGESGVDVYLNDRAVVDELDFRDHSGFETWDTGQYTARVFAAGADPAADAPLVETVVELNAGDVVSLVAVGVMDGARLVPVFEDSGALEGSNTLRVTVVNALNGRPFIDIVDDDDDAHRVLVDNVPFGEASEPQEIEAETLTVGVYQDGDESVRLVALEDQDLETDTSVLWVFAEQRRSDNSWENIALTLMGERDAAFGSPTHVGRLLFTRYILPFEMVALVLLAAMIGAIVLTHETTGPRRQVVRRLANPPAGLEKPVTPDTGK